MRWLVVHPGPSFSVADVYAGWVEALRNAGEHVIEYNLDDRLSMFGSALRQVDAHTFARMHTAEQSYELAADGLYSTLYKTWPDVLLIVSGFFVPHQLLDRARRTRTRVVILHTETPYELDRQLAMAPYADLNIVDDVITIERFEAIGPTMFMSKAYRPSIHHPGPAIETLRSDLAFVGTGYPSRIEFFESMNLDDIDVLLAGNWQALGDESPLHPFVGHDPEDCLDNAKTADVYRSAQVGINLYRREAQRPELSHGWAMGPREVEMAACGLFFLRESRGEGDEVLDMLPVFTSPAEASELIRYWLDRPDERQALADKARAAIAGRTFDSHAAGLLRLLNN